MRKGDFLKKKKKKNNLIAFAFLVVSTCCLFIVFLSVLRLPEISGGFQFKRSRSVNTNTSESKLIGKFGEMMIAMLPQDLAFTVFVPSEMVFERDLRLGMNASKDGEDVNDIEAVISRLLGFSAVPRIIGSDSVPIGKEISYDSLSGYTLYMSKDRSGMLVVNGVRSERLGIMKGQILVHVMDGCIMDADFERSVLPDHNDDGQA